MKLGAVGYRGLRQDGGIICGGHLKGSRNDISRTKIPRKEAKWPLNLTVTVKFILESTKDHDRQMVPVSPVTSELPL